MHIPARLDCYVTKWLPRPWTMLDQALHARGLAMTNPVAKCRAHPSDDPTELQGACCEGCARLPEKIK